MRLIELYNNDSFMRFIIKAIMLKRDRLKYKRDRLRAELKLYSDQCVDFTMIELRELHYFLHPTDKRKH